MKSTVVLVLLIVLFCFCFCFSSALSLDDDLSCSACRVLLDEVDYKLRSNKQHGNMHYSLVKGSKQKLYHRSESHIFDILDKVCKEEMDNYAVSGSAPTREYIRYQPHRGESGSFSISGNIQIGGDTSALKFACEFYAGEFDEEIVVLMQGQKGALSKSQTLKFCSKMDACKGNDVEQPSHEEL